MRTTCSQKFFLLLIFIQLTSCTFEPKSSSGPLVFEQNEKVLFLGNAFFENSFANGEIETMFSLCFPKKNITFRNLGWSGDNVNAYARTRARNGQRFGAPEDGFSILTQQITDFKADKIFIAYGFNESFENERGINSYGQGLKYLLNMLQLHCPELIVISTLPMEKGYGIPDDHIEKRNSVLKKYAEATKKITMDGRYRFIDLFTPFSHENNNTINGIHLSSKGYRKAGNLIANELSFPKPAVKIDSREADQIRNTIIKKNTLFFQRWRPQNDAYVYGLRKHEQPIAQEEPAQIEPFIAKQEETIKLLLEKL